MQYTYKDALLSLRILEDTGALHGIIDNVGEDTGYAKSNNYQPGGVRSANQQIIG
jgi:hypothetical protein